MAKMLKYKETGRDEDRIYYEGVTAGGVPIEGWTLTEAGETKTQAAVDKFNAETGGEARWGTVVQEAPVEQA